MYSLVAGLCISLLTPAMPVAAQIGNYSAVLVKAPATGPAGVSNGVIVLEAGQQLVLYAGQVIVLD